MYWNNFIVETKIALFRLIETWDVLKWLFQCICGVLLAEINRNMRCIEILMRNEIEKRTDEINRNMRCIEIEERYASYVEGGTINRNMRCIEMWRIFLAPYSPGMINRNMRCIEIILTDTLFHKGTRLIETWDVLKLLCVLFLFL